ncbi:MAG: L,D-transpeptidase [bacterium]
MKSSLYCYRKNYSYLIKVILTEFILEVYKKVKKKNYKRIKSFSVGIGLNTNNNNKQREGDKCTPLGTYYICEKAEIYGDKTKGPCWLRLTYPNNFDIKRGVLQNIISFKQAAILKSAYKNSSFKRIETPLGFGIGIHGTNRPGSIGTRCSDGCIRMHNRDVLELFRIIPTGIKVEILL